jgi:hypothetical protein
MLRWPFRYRDGGGLKWEMAVRQALCSDCRNAGAAIADW